jgi:hypothetical protein
MMGRRPDICMAQASLALGSAGPYSVCESATVPSPMTSHEAFSAPSKTVAQTSTPSLSPRSAECSMTSHLYPNNTVPPPEAALSLAEPGRIRARSPRRPCGIRRQALWDHYT